MINKIPMNFTYNKSTENLFLFYQRVSELLFDYSPDSYKTSTHNSHTLCVEAYNIYSYLKTDGSSSKFFEQYIPDIISELLITLRKDNAAKTLLGQRYEKYLEILEQCKNAKGTELECKFFESNIINLTHQFSQRKYYAIICTQLSDLICGEKKQQDIIALTNTFICELIHLGYTKQHIYNVVMDFFQKPITDARIAIEALLKLFTFDNKTWQIITFANTKLLGYYKDELSKVIGNYDISLEEVSSDALDKLIEETPSYTWIRETRDRLNVPAFPIAPIKAHVHAFDPYSGYEKLDSFLNAINNFVTIFDNEPKMGYPSIACLNYQYKKTITFKRAMNKRVQLNQVDNYAKHAASVLQKMRMSSKMFKSFTKTAKFHGEALGNSENDSYTLVMLWTALEALFVDNSIQSQKSKLVMESLIEIIQRTYIIKSIKYLQYDLVRHLKSIDPDLIDKYSLNNTSDFINILFSDSSEPAVVDICHAIESNPLLRSRIFYITDTCCKDNKKILAWLNNHEEKINWQIKRIYRTRNLIVHTGRNVPYVKDLVENLHDYVDFILNFIICKSWYGEQIADIRSLVAEVKLDNEIHRKYLHTNEKDSTKKHIFESLFGPSANVLEYYADWNV